MSKHDRGPIFASRAPLVNAGEQGESVVATAARKLEAASQEADNWIHRSATMRCMTCMYFVPKNTVDPSAPLLGRCRRHAPTMSGWPAMFGDDWCGDHRIDAEKL